MTFKHFYYSKKDNKDFIFESVFDKYYNKGYFGHIKEDVIKSQQKNWFEKFLLILEEGDEDSLNAILSTRDNLCTREWFSRIYGEDILDKSREEIRESVKLALKNVLI